MKEEQEKPSLSTSSLGGITSTNKYDSHLFYVSKGDYSLASASVHSNRHRINQAYCALHFTSYYEQNCNFLYATTCPILCFAIACLQQCYAIKVLKYLWIVVENKKESKKAVAFRAQTMHTPAVAMAIFPCLLNHFKQEKHIHNYCARSENNQTKGVLGKRGMFIWCHFLQPCCQAFRFII